MALVRYGPQTPWSLRKQKQIVTIELLLLAYASANVLKLMIVYTDFVSDF